MSLRCCECDVLLVDDGCPNRSCCEWTGLSMEDPPGRYLCDDMRHLVCLPYSTENLHLMAADLGIKRCWFHSSSHGRLAHYDIPKRRITEITAKCELVSSREILVIVKGERNAL